MTPTRAAGPLLLLLLAGAACARAAEAVGPAPPAAPRADYLRAYGLVAGQVHAVETVHALCAERFPDASGTREVAMQQWRDRHRPLLRLVDDQPAVMAADNEGLPESQRIDVARLLEARDRLRERTRRTLSTQPERLRALCDRYVTTLSTPDVDAIEARRATEIEALRRGPLGTRAPMPAASVPGPAPVPPPACPGPELGAGCGPIDVDRAQRAAPAPAPR